MINASIVIPSYNRPDRLKACLEALTRQTMSELEIVVVDDGSDTPLQAVCDGFANVRCIRQDNAGPAAARNRGAKDARGTFLVFTDDDCRPRPEWIDELKAAHAGVDKRLVGGRVENGLPDNPYATASQDICDFLYEWFGASAGHMPFFTSNNIGCARARFLALGGFDESFPLAAAEDREFGIRWREQGGELVYTEAAVIDHFHSMTMANYWNQHQNYGRGAKHLHDILEARGSDLPRREKMAFYLSLMSRPIAKQGLAGVQGSALAFLSQVAMVKGYTKQSRGQR